MLLAVLFCASGTTQATTHADSTVEHLQTEVERLAAEGNSQEFHDMAKQLRADIDAQKAEEAERRVQEKYRYRTATALMALLVLTSMVFFYMNHRLRARNRDLAMARRAEQKARQQAEGALNVKRTFLNNVSHEMRTPLNAIVGFSNLLANHELELTQEEKADMSNRIQENANLLISIVDNMIELSRYESLDALSLDDEVSPNTVARMVVEMKQDETPDGIALSYGSTLSDDTLISTNLQAVDQLLAHLVDNALKFTKEGRVEVRVGQEGDNVLFSVADTGPGIAPNQRPHLFEPFTETGHTVKTTGMGLSICRRIAILLGGSIWLDPDYTDGSRFVCSLPMAGATVGAGPVPARLPDRANLRDNAGE